MTRYQRVKRIGENLQLDASKTAHAILIRALRRLPTYTVEVLDRAIMERVKQ